MQIRLVPQRGAFCNFDESIKLYGTHWIRYQTQQTISKYTCQHINTDVDTIYFNEKSDLCCFGSSIMV